MNVEEQWKSAQVFEKKWWIENASEHQHEIEKGDMVGRLMLLDKGTPTKTVLDIGCGPFSLLQRVPVKEGTGLDPIYYNDLEINYRARRIQRLIKSGEDLSIQDGTFDEVWIYNCLQHVKNPTKILENAIEVGTTIRIFEWTHIPPYEGHLHELTPDLLSEPFKRNNLNLVMETRGHMNHSGLIGDYYMAIFSKNQSESFST